MGKHCVILGCPRRKTTKRGDTFGRGLNSGPTSHCERGSRWPLSRFCNQRWCETKFWQYHKLRMNISQCDWCCDVRLLMLRETTHSTTRHKTSLFTTVEVQRHQDLLCCHRTVYVHESWFRCRWCIRSMSHSVAWNKLILYTVCRGLYSAWSCNSFCKFAERSFSGARPVSLQTQYNQGSWESMVSSIISEPIIYRVRNIPADTRDVWIIYIY